MATPSTVNDGYPPALLQLCDLLQKRKMAEAAKEETIDVEEIAGPVVQLETILSHYSRHTCVFVLRMRVVEEPTRQIFILKHVRERRSGLNWCQTKYWCVAGQGAYMLFHLTMKEAGSDQHACNSRVQRW